MSDHGKILDISTDDLKSTAPAFHTQSEALRHAAAKLQSTLDSLGSPWGGDEQGKAFHDAYAPHVVSIAKTTAILIEGLASIHDGLHDMADGHINNEELNRALFTKTDRQDPAQ
jgi:uncharacterized protein YukE